MNIDIHIIINMNIEYYIMICYLLSITLLVLIRVLYIDYTALCIVPSWVE